MKYNKFVRIVLLAAIAIGTVAVSLFISNKAIAQNDFISELTDRLRNQGVPLTNIALTSRLPFRLEIVLQSTSDSGVVAPDDPLFEHIVQREVNLAQGRYDINLDTVRINIVNTLGDSIYQSEVPVFEISNTFGASQLDNASTAELVSKGLPLYGMSLDNLDVSLDANGARVLTIQLSVPDLETANKSVSQFMPDLYNLVDDLNAKNNSQISIYRVTLLDSESKPLLKYVRDTQLSQQNWWQADGLTQDWFPHPPSP